MIEQFRYLVDRSPAAAGRWYAGIEKAVTRLRMRPELHPLAQKETEQLGITLRQMFYGRRPGVFRILFSVEGDTVTCIMSATVPVAPPSL